MDNKFKTEYFFELPHGYIDKNGNCHSKGIMRLASPADEILTLKDPRVQKNPHYIMILVLARVVKKIEGIENIDTTIIENLLAADFVYLQNMYNRINQESREAAQESATLIID